MKVWGFYKGSGHLPHRAEVRSALATSDTRILSLTGAITQSASCVPG